ncbi:MAG: HAD family hydrolase, partial [Acidimicrobiia bacterium]|nr:HAD family hydrolase [Acidimicrobiia bacterium]
LDAGKIPETLGYEELFVAVHEAVDAAHEGGGLKERILADPDRFVDHDPRVVPTLLDQRAAGKRLLLITNSDWTYASAILDRYVTPDVPDGTWRDLFDVVVVAADKPRFFSSDRAFFEVVDGAEGLLKRHRGPLEQGTVYSGGSAAQVEESLGLSGDEVLYVGDHLFGDVHVSKAIHRWRTALVIRELEDELAALDAFAPTEQQLTDLMVEKGGLESRFAARRLELLHDGGSVRDDDVATELSRSLSALDEQIAPLAIASGGLHNASWGLLMRAGLDKSLFARQVERYADVYTSRVAHLRDVTPFGMLRAAWTSLPHD